VLHLIWLVIIATPNMVGNNYDEYWHGKYEISEYGEKIYEEYEYKKEVPIYTEKIVKEKVLEKVDGYYFEIEKEKVIKDPLIEKVNIYDEKGVYLRADNIHKTRTIIKTGKRQKISKNFDPNLKYVSRKDRPEWNIVGLLGQVYIKHGQIIHNDWIKMRDINDDVSLFFIR